MLYLFNSLTSIFYPRLCVVCNEPLADSDKHICLQCRMNLPTTDYSPDADTPARERFRGIVTLEKAYSYLYYNKGGVGQRIVAEIKYRKNIRLGFYMGNQIARELEGKRFFDDIDYLIPVPLHPGKRRKRGFNQSEIVAQGIASVCGVRQDNSSLIRTKANTSQTTKGVYERQVNTQGLFALKDREKFIHRHVLFVDDVLTTGATLRACIEPFLDVEGIRISILTLAIA